MTRNKYILLGHFKASVTQIEIVEILSCTSIIIEVEEVEEDSNKMASVFGRKGLSGQFFRWLKYILPIVVENRNTFIFVMESSHS